MKIIASIVLVLLGIAFAKPKERKPYFVGQIMVKSAPSEYRCGYLYFPDSVVKAYLYNGTSVVFMAYDLGGLKAYDCTPGFNRTVILDQNHYPWVEVPGTQTGACTRFSTDTTGAQFNDNMWIYSYFSSYFSTSIDSTKIYAFGNADSYKWIDNTGNRTYQPYLLWTAPAGKKIKKLACGTSFFILLTTGEVYQRPSGTGTTFTQRTFSGKCVDIGSSQNNFAIYLIHDYPGGDSSQGNPYWTGSESGFVGDNNSRTEPFALKTIWGTTMPFRAVVTNSNTYHMFDSTWRLWGGGDGAQGEIGDSTEIVNRYTYINFNVRTYAWSTVKCQGGTCHIPKPIARNINWTNGRFTSVGNSFTFYNGANDVNDSFYVWGRSKSFVAINIASNDESLYPNTLDRLWPQHYCPLCTPTGTYSDFTLPIVHCGGNKTVTTSSTTLGGNDTAAIQGGYGFTITSTQWTQKSGPNTATFTTPTNKNTSVTGLVNGTYVFKKEITDNNFGIWADSAIVTVNISPPSGCGGCVVLKQFRNFKRFP